MSNNEDDQAVEEFLPRLRKRPETVTLTVPTKTLLKKVSAVAVGRGLSVRDQTAFVGSVIAAAGGNVNNFTLSLPQLGATTELLKERLTPKSYLPGSSQHIVS